MSVSVSGFGQSRWVLVLVDLDSLAECKCIGTV